MKAVLQRAAHAKVTVEGEIVGQIDRPGILALVGVHRDDTAADAAKLARRIATLKMLSGEQSVLEESAPVLVVSQFTLQARTRKGAKPSWSDAAPREVAEPLVDALVQELRAAGVEVATGVFGAMMEVSLVNSGPFTLIVDTAQTRSGANR